MDLTRLEWLKGETIDWKWSLNSHEMKIHCATAKRTFTGLTHAIGIDPGRKFGLSLVYPLQDIFGGQLLTTYWGTFPAMDHDYEYFGLVCDFVYEFVTDPRPVKIVLIEGPAYGKQYKREMLEDIRIAFYHGLVSKGIQVDYVAPLTVRKQVFGNGNTKASKVWLEIDGNAADSAAIALYAGGYNYEER